MSPARFPILFITSSRIGDAVLSSGLLARLEEEVPQASFTIAAGPLALPLFRDTPRLERLIPIEKRRWGGHWFDLWREVRSQRWGLVLDMRGSGLSRFLSTRRRAIHHRGPSSAPPVHKVVEAARLLHLEADPPAPHLFTSPETEEKASALLGPGDAPILAVAPAASWVGKAWAAENFAVLASQLLGPGGPMAGGRLLLLGGPDDRWACEHVRRVTPRGRLIDAVGRIDLLVAYAALKRTRLFVGNDSGLMHLAAAAGAPTLGLFGPSDDRLYAPWGPNGRALRAARSFDEYRAADPELNQKINHMRDLPVEWAARAARALLADTERDFPTPVVETEALNG